MLPHLSLGELVLLLVVVLLLFGPKRLPELAASFGKSIRSFKDGLKESSKEDRTSEASKESSDKSA